MGDRILFWHRRDLRLHDNVGLAAAHGRSPQVIGVFCLDPALLNGPGVAPVRVTYMVQSLAALESRYQALGGTFLVVQGQPETILPALAQAIAATAVYWNRDVEPYSRDRDTRVAAALKAIGIEIKTTFWDQLLHAPGEVLTGAGKPYTVYGPFWRNWRAQPKAPPVPEPTHFIGLDDGARVAAKAAGALPLPTAADLGCTWENPLPVEPGEAAALAQLEQFCHQGSPITAPITGPITAYDEQRNYPAMAGTSRLSAALKFGVIGIRTVWAATVAAQAQTHSDGIQPGIETWQQELAWREFYQHVLYFFPQLATGPYRAQWQDFPWLNNEAHFQAWCQGRTGYPIVDAAMGQLNATGWMHNRCRMIVASFLTKDLMIDWRWGERYFMETLVDGDLAANNGGWQWSASSGMDPKPLRIFNPASQAQKFDPDGEYIRYWLPEIRHLDTTVLVTGELSEGDRDGTGYPAPIVNHKKQQARFKDLYKAQKERSEKAVPKD